MPSFEYLVKDKTGKDLKGVQEAPDATELVRLLKTQGYLVIRVEQVKKAPRS
jgi:type II secretory pathway component PulF